MGWMGLGEIALRDLWPSAVSGGDSRAPPPLPSQGAHPPKVLLVAGLCLLQRAPRPCHPRRLSLHLSEVSPLTHESNVAPQTLHQQHFPTQVDCLHLTFHHIND